MNILLNQVRIYGFRGLKNIEIDLKQTTVIVGSNNSGKTTFLRALQIALSNSFTVSSDDFYYDETTSTNQIIIDVSFIPVDENHQQIAVFSDEWQTVFTVDKIALDVDGQQSVRYRTIIEEDPVRDSYRKKQYIIDVWEDFEASGHFWYQQEYTSELRFYFDEIPFHYMDANRDILEDIKNKRSYLGKILSSIEYPRAKKEEIERLIQELNQMAINGSAVLTDITATLSDLDTTMDNSNRSVNLSPFTKKVKDFNKSIKIQYADFAMDYHGMGTRSWSSLLVLKAFIAFYHKRAVDQSKLFFPIVAVEEPEAHLHPNAQKKLYSQINNIRGQKIISTHSSYVAGCADLHEIRVLSKQDTNVLVGQLETELLDSEQKRQINRQVVNTRGELFFAKAVVLFEGETEEQVLPVLAERHFGLSALELGVNFVGVGGYTKYTPFIQFCEAFNIAYYIFSDNDKSGAVNTSVTNQINAATNKDLSVVVFLEEECDFEQQLIYHGYLEEVKEALIECKIRKNNAIRPEHIADINRQVSADSNEEIYKAITGMKTQFAATIAPILFDSEKPLPPKIIELFNKLPITEQSDD
ncbi:MAG: AAA family ATPase [Aureispira sp.]